MPRIRDTDLYKNTVEGKDGKFKARLLKELAIVKKEYEGRINWDNGYYPIALNGAFVFSETSQGTNFWWYIFQRKEFP